MSLQTTIAAVYNAPPFTTPPNPPINSETRPAARTWLQRMDWPHTIVMALTNDELHAAYSTYAGLSEVAGRHGAPLPSQEIAARHAHTEYCPRNSVLLANLARRGFPATAEPAPAPAPARPAAPVQLSLDTPPATTNDKAAQLARLLAEIAGPQESALDESRVVELIRAHAPKPTEIVHTFHVTTADHTRALPNAPRHALFPKVLAATAAGRHVMIVGPAGSGKTHLAGQVAEALGLDFSFTGAIDTPYKLLGFVDAQGRTVRTPYRERYEHGGVFLIDEIDGSDPRAILPLNAGLANGHQDFPDTCVKRHDLCRIIASANTFGRGPDRQYVGRNQLDAASLDRFVFFTMDYDEDLERAIFGTTPWVARVHSVRRAVASLKVRHVVSMRALADGTALLAGQAMTQEEIESAVLWKGLDAATVAKIEAEAR